MAKKTSDELNKTPSRQSLYARVAHHAPEAVETLLVLMRTAKNESVRISAANKLLDKCIPDLKAMEMSGNEGGDIILRLVREDKPTYVK